MKFHYAGKYSGKEEDLPQREHPANYVPYREPDMKQLAIIANVGAVLTMIVFGIPYALLGKPYLFDHSIEVSIGAILSLLVLFPHEVLHGICFKEDVYMYTNLKQGMLFVVGTEDMSRARFIFMSLLPNVLFGCIPYLLFLFHPRLVGLGFFGLLCLGMGFGDYINVFNTLTQVPRGALVYLCGMHSFWYKR